MTIRNVPLAEARARVRQLDTDLKDHKTYCLDCRPRAACQEARDMAAELTALRRDIKTWFDPGPDQGALL
jgi:hypothetical protein